MVVKYILYVKSNLSPKNEAEILKRFRFTGETELSVSDNMHN